MNKFNETSLASGFIKQLLHSFNLPKFRVYTIEQEKYAKNYATAKNKLTVKYNQANNKIVRNNVLKRIEDLEKKPILTPKEEIELKALKEQVAECNRLETTLNQLLETPSELNVVETVYRNSIEKYPRSSTDLYPEHMTYVPYIKNGIYQEYSNGKWHECHATFDEHDDVHTDKKGLFTIKRFLYNRFDRNYTTNLQIKNNIYDSYTHEYLGNYLRFLRDYNNLDLMSMYNCFSNRTCDNIMLSFNIDGNSNKIKFYYNDSNYKIYMLPVKLFKDYTIAIDCSSPVEMFCAVYGSYLDEDIELSELPKLTYKKFNNMLFNNPEIYSTNILSENTLGKAKLSKLAQKERDLKLFIKIPMSNDSSITILEGNYQSYNDTIASFNKIDRDEKGNPLPTPYVKLEYSCNKSIINLENEKSFDDFKPISRLQLLMINTHESYPYATKLLDYLTDHAITHLDKIDDNVMRVKTIADHLIDKNKHIFEIDHLWTKELRAIIYNYMIEYMEKTGKSSLNRDILGYVDRDVEKYLAYSYVGKDKVKYTESLVNVDLYESEDGSHEWR